MISSVFLHFSTNFVEDSCKNPSFFSFFFVILFLFFCWLWWYWLRERFDEIGRRIRRERDASIIISQQMGINGSNVLGINTITPCAACKLLRRRCAEDCPFSPYFSPLEPYRFAAVHRVFGASNVSKMLMVYINFLDSSK